jgi:RNA polymerase sigma-70 factor (ECF subfamily)
MIDPERFSELFEAQAASLALYARQWLNAGGAEDVVQEAFARLLAQRVEPTNARAWLFTTVRNEAISQARSKKRRQRREQIAGREEWFEYSPGDPIDGRIAAEAMKQLSAVQREAIVLRVWGGLSLKEIGAILGCSISTAFDHYRAGLAALRKQMGIACQNNKE